MRAWRINGVEKRGKLAKRKMLGRAGGRAEVELNLLFISEHAIYGQQRKDFHTNFWGPPTPSPHILRAMGSLVLILSLCMENLLTL